MNSKTKKTAAPKAATSLVLRVCRADGSSKNGFVWPLQIGAEVVCPDWIDNSECGNGLHGWLYGQGDHNVSDYWADADAKWFALEVLDSDIRMLGGKCKFPRAVVRFVGTKSEAADFIVQNEPRAASVAVIGLVREVGDGGACEGGALSSLTGGSGSTLTGGDGSTLTGGYGSTLTGGEKSEFRFQAWDSSAERYRTVLAYVGEDGIKPDTAYRLQDGKPVEVTE